jgi:hypothetical protein
MVTRVVLLLALLLAGLAVPARPAWADDLPPATTVPSVTLDLGDVFHVAPQLARQQVADWEIDGRSGGLYIGFGVFLLVFGVISFIADLVRRRWSDDD